MESVFPIPENDTVKEELVNPYFLPLSSRGLSPSAVPLPLPCVSTWNQAPASAFALSLERRPASGAPNSHGVTGGVYKARERIHRGMLIRDY